MISCSSSSNNNNNNKNSNNDRNDLNNDNCSIKDPILFIRDEKDKRTKSRLNIEDVQFSAGYSREQGMKDLRVLLCGLDSGVGEGRWTITPDAKGVERIFKFKGFKNAWAFMNIIASESAQKKHHPEWSNIYNTVFIRWTTHYPAGLSEKDVLSARTCDEHAQILGEITTEVNDGNCLGSNQKLVNNIVDIARDCCMPKKLLAT
ncbi:Pterin-4-alpha-carbinolamine dehydratase [Erysiphe neolycopersici]|uniref:4a-hydroxytetrahydrobiopterin dehydratase n=1 Tax=Erysiphe neolycopersici TaxID=212602 RepID=A0A420HWS2_9PEZI|nr:Pterin-4-alpha-carbinolamine dehydratase [Erysiphe neolycopersici]